MRCFIAAWPDSSTRVALARLSDDVAQRITHRRATRVDDLHLTLAFIGELTDDVAFDLDADIAAFRFEPMDWQIDMLGFFEPGGILWAGGDPTVSLVDLAGRIRALLDRANIAYDPRPLAPHITLLRGVKSFAAQRVAAIPWRVASIALYRSVPSCQASRYSRVKR